MQLKPLNCDTNVMQYYNCTFICDLIYKMSYRRIKSDTRFNSFRSLFERLYTVILQL